ncbi:MAG: hypothetical protein ABSD68_03195 [Candidatus Micrarchaeales archaeon]
MRIRNLLGILLLLSGLLPVVVFAGTSGPSPIPPPPAFQIRTPALTLCRGVVNRVLVNISNPGSQPMTSLQLGLVASKNIYAIGNGTVNQATVPANGTTAVTLPIFVSLNTSSLVSVGISVNYNYYSLYSDSEVRNVSFGVETCPSPLLVETNSTVTSGRIENMTLNLTNVGNTVLNAVSLRISLPSQDAAILTNQPIQIGTIAPGVSKKVTERLFMFRNASQTFPLNVSIQLYNGTSPVQLLDTIPLLSSGIINITPSSVTISPASPTIGSIFSVSLILTDTGTAGASAVTATALPPRGITSYGSNSVFIGDMSVDTQTPVTMTMQSNSSLKNGSYTIPIRISYLNNLRENINTTILVPVTIGAALTSNFTRTGTSVSRYSGAAGFVLMPVILVIVIIIVIALAFLYMRERKRARKAK